MVPKGYIGTLEAAERLNCSRRYVNELLRLGKLRGKRFLDRWLVSEKALEGFTTKGRKTSPGRKPKPKE